MTKPKSPTHNQMTIMNLLDADDWESVITRFAGLPKEQIFARLENEDKERNNIELSNSLFEELPRFLTVLQTAAISGLSKITVCNKCPAGQLPGAFKRGHLWLIPATVARNLERRPSRWDHPEWKYSRIENSRFHKKRSQKAINLNMTQPKQLTKNQMALINLLDVDEWKTVIVRFAGLTKEQIFTQLEQADPERDNIKLTNFLFGELPRFLDADQVAAISGFSPSTIRKKCPPGQIPGAFKKDQQWLIPAAAARNLKRQPSRWDNAEWQSPQTENPADSLEDND